MTTDTKLVLVVDDDLAIQSFLKVALMDEGYQVMLAGNGAVALDLIAKTPPNVVILDMKMPVMDGWAFLKVYCASKLPTAPVISISANVGELGTVECASHFLSKPFNLDSLITLVEQYTSQN